MAIVDGDGKRLFAQLNAESECTKDCLRKVLLLVRKGHIHQVPPVFDDLLVHAALLAGIVEQVRVSPFDGGLPRHALTFATEEALRNRLLLKAPVYHATAPDERLLYCEELGFSETDYEALLTLKAALFQHDFDLKAAFDEFVSKILKDSQSKIRWDGSSKLIDALCGMVGIATDISQFILNPQAVGSLVSSSATGLVLIAKSYPEVKRFLSGLRDD